MVRNRLKGHIFYLAGGIQYIPDLGVDWREVAQKELWKMGIGVFNPMDKACNFANEDKDTQTNIKRLLQEGEYEAVSSIMRGIVRADLRMVDLSSAILARIDSSKHTAGTYAELTQAYLQRKPVILYSDDGVASIPSWWFGHGDPPLFFNSLEESLKYIHHINEDENIQHLKRWKFFDFDKVFGVHNVS
jgi:nucleoside 2-deoxyribosyltransferase